MFPVPLECDGEIFLVWMGLGPEQAYSEFLANLVKVNLANLVKVNLANLVKVNLAEALKWGNFVNNFDKNCHQCSQILWNVTEK